MVGDRSAEARGAVGSARHPRALEGLRIAHVADRPCRFGTGPSRVRPLSNEGGMLASESISASSSFARESISLPKLRESTAKTEDLRGGEPSRNPSICRYFVQRLQEFTADGVVGNRSPWTVGIEAASGVPVDFSKIEPARLRPKQKSRLHGRFGDKAELRVGPLASRREPEVAPSVQDLGS